MPHPSLPSKPAFLSEINPSVIDPNSIDAKPQASSSAATSVQVKGDGAQNPPDNHFISPVIVAPQIKVECDGEVARPIPDDQLVSDSRLAKVKAEVQPAPNQLPDTPVNMNNRSEYGLRADLAKANMEVARLTALTKKLEQEKTEIVKSNVRKQTRLEDNHHKIKELEQSRRQDRVLQDSRGQLLTEVEASRNKLWSEIRDKDASLKDANSTKDNLARSIHQLRGQLANAKATATSLEHQLQETHDRTNRVSHDDAHVASLTQQLSHKETRLHQLEFELKEARDKVMLMEKEQTKLKNTSTRLETKSKDLAVKLDNSIKNERARSLTIEQLNNELTKASRPINMLTEKIDQLKSDIPREIESSLRSAVATRSAEVASLQAQVTSLQQKLLDIANTKPQPNDENSDLQPRKRRRQNSLEALRGQSSVYRGSSRGRGPTSRPASASDSLFVHSRRN